MAAVDILIGFGKLTKRSEVAKKVFCRPEFVEDEGDQQEHEPVLELVQGWHPLLSYYLASDAIMQNDIKIGEGHGGQAMLLTGPNMGGKSTLLRLSAVCIIMAQVGCWVPAKAMRLSLFDRIFTRMGAEDRLLEGMSTFFVELQDTSVMLHHATRRSLVILDELGRGTSTWDGTAIAYSVLKYFQRMGCICLFATHLLGVITAENKVKVCHMELEGSKPTFRLKAGLAPYGSCGIALAERAGLPKQLVQRAQQISLD
jgi:DNA mismatch repair protein MSH6